MGDNLPEPRFAEFQPSSHHPSHIAPSVDDEAAPGSPLVNGEDEPYTIKCICRFDDDTYDGSTVFCERCDTWQHIACYYAKPSLPDDFEHSCIDCNPSQRVDPIAARQRQEALRVPDDTSDEPRVKKQAKNHKKSKVRDHNNAIHQINGAASLPFGALAPRSTSPRDQGPPTKRPKTSHRTQSVATISSGKPLSGRARTNSSTPLMNLPEPQTLPLSQCPPDYLSPEFIQVHHDNTDFRNASANLHMNIGVTNMLSMWLDDQDAFAEATNGLTHNDVFQHFPQHIEELETPIEKRAHTDTTVSFHGAHPIWPYLTVEKDLMSGDFVGELRGSIGHRNDWISDPANQWERLRHPDHFVFFHPLLPIYIDSRTDGTLLRYARRSCRPNLNMQTLITGEREYRFCFTANGDIAQGTEITIPWDTKCDEHLQACLGKSLANMPPSDFEYVSEWAGKVLAHFGGCACDSSKSKCLLATFDRRLADSSAQGRNRKKRKYNRVTPPNTGNATNSRASSSGPFALQNGEVEVEDDRSSSRSNENRTSRDATPSATSRQNSAAPHNELSERDKRKLQQQERLFEQMEQDTGSKKKKRANGSVTTTPTFMAHSRIASRINGAISIPFTSPAGGKPRFAEGNVPYSSTSTQTPTHSALQQGSPLTIGEAALLPKVQAQRPVYADASTQTDADSRNHRLKLFPTRRRPVLPLSKRLLKRSLLQRYREDHRAVDSACVKSESPSSMLFSPVFASANEEQEQLANMKESLQQNDDSGKMETSVPEDIQEVEVPSADLAEPVESSVSSLKQEPSPTAEPATENHFGSDENTHTKQRRAPVASMHVDMPPAPTFFKPALTSSSGNARSPDPLTPGAARSPDIPNDAKPPLVTSSTGGASQNITRPSPVKKKMSLSDYMSKRKAETPAIEKPQNQGSLGIPSGEGGQVSKEGMD